MLPKIKTLTLVCLLLVLSANSLLAQVVANAGVNQTICAGGTATIGGTPTATGGVPPYTYIWSPVVGLSSDTVANPMVSPNVTTIYTVTVTDATPHTATASVTITVNPVPQIDSFHIVNVGCNDSATGSICAYASGADGPFTYHWSNGSTNQCITHLIAWSYYSVTVTNSLGCSTIVDTAVSQPAPMTVSFTDVNVTCNGQSNGSINTIVSGGVPPYEFEWSNGAFNIQEMPNLSYGIYGLTIIDANACSITNSTTITQPSALHDSIAVTNVSCFGGSNGSACNYVTGGTPGYNYYWADGANTSCTLGVPTGIYSVTVTDANGCTATASGSITQPALITQTDSVGNASCINVFDGTITVTASGGTRPYLYSVNGGTLQSSNLFTGLAAGTYAVQVTDNAGCSNTAEAVINITYSVTGGFVSQTGISCYGGSDITIVQLTGGISPYQYSINGTVFQPSGEFIGLTAAEYVFTARDSRGCTAFIPDTITQPAALNINVSTTGTHILPDTAGLLVNGGTGPYSVTWGDGQNSNLPGDTASHIYHTTGIYTITVNDAHSCGATYTLQADTTLPLIANAGSNATICLYNPAVLGGNPTATGGTPPYTYTWSDGLPAIANPTVWPGLNHTYTLTVTDANSVSATSSVTITVGPGLNAAFAVSSSTCLGSSVNFTDQSTPPAGVTAWSWDFGNGTTSNVQNPINTFVTGGIYPVTLTVSNGVCNADTTINVTINQAPLATFTATSPVCEGQNSTLTYTGNASVNATYTWNFDGATIASGTGQGPYQVNWSTGGTKSPTLVVTDLGCTSTPTTQEVVVNPLPGITLTPDTSVACGGSITLTASGAATYTWTPAAGLNSTSTATVVATPTSNTTYIVTGSSSGCSATDSVTVTITGLQIDSIIATSARCYGDTTSICAYATGTGTLQYAWNNAASSSCISTIIAGTYIVTVTNGTTCSAMASATVLLLTTLHNTIETANITCSLCDSASGGTTPYNYLWSNSVTSQCITGLANGTCITWVTDANGCYVMDTATFTNNLHFQALTPDTNAVPDSVSLTMNGGTAPYTVIWGDGQSSNEIDSTAMHIYSASGVYYVILQDSFGCGTYYRVDAGCTDQCIWPGDANYDGVVNNLDLLSIGVGYDTTGPVRINPTINFIPQYCPLWADTLLGGVNYKHVDCNGDGIINADDTSAVVLNYSLTHVRGGGGTGWKADDPALYITTSPDTVGDGQILTATLSLGSQALPVTNAYALAFTYNFDPLVVDTTDVNFTFGNSWLFSAGNHINITKSFYPEGQMQVAITRINHIAMSGSGPIATVSMKITTGNINGKNLMYYTMNNFISGLTVIDNEGHVLAVNAGFDSAEVAFSPTNVIEVKNTNTQVQIFPNPASDQLNILSAQSDIEEITIFYLAGQQVIHQNMQAGNYSVINVSELSDGVYIIKLKTGAQEYYSRFVKTAAK